MIVRLDLADLLVQQDARRPSCRRESPGALRARSVGQSESVSRGQPSGGFVFSYDFSSGLSDHFGVNDGPLVDLVQTVEHHPGAVGGDASPFSTYLMGACMRFVSL